MKDFLHILLIAMILCCWSCSGGGEDVPTPTPTPKPEEKPKVEVTTAAPVLAQEGGTASVTFTSTAAWTIDVTEGRAVSWCNVSPTSGGKGTNTLTITTTGNDTYDERNAKVTIKAGATTQAFTITQKQKDGLTVTSNKVEVKAEGGDIAIEVKANVKYEYAVEESAKDWITSNSSRGLTASTLTFKVAENENTSKREGKITIHSGELSETVTVYQEGSKPVIVLTQNEYTVGSEGAEIKVELKSNVNYEVQIPNVDWVYENKSRSLSSSTHYFTVASNDTYDARSAEIIFINKENNLSEKVTIQQAQKNAIIVANNEYQVEAAGGELKFDVNTNVEFKVETSADWITQNTGSRGLEAKPLSFNIAENTGENIREGVITISAGELKQEIKVRQKGKAVAPYIKVSHHDFSSPHCEYSIFVTIESNIEYEILFSDNWLRASSNGKEYEIFIDANKTSEERTGKVTVKNEEYGITEVITIKQEGFTPYFEIDKNSFELNYDQHFIDVNIKSNLTFDVVISSNWIYRSSSTQRGEEYKFGYGVKSNNTKKSRTATITYKNEEYGIEKVVIVEQGTSHPGKIELNQKSFELNHAKQTVELIVKSNLYITYELSADWINLKQIETKEEENAYVYVLECEVNANESSENRSATITFRDKDSNISKKVTIKQEHNQIFEIEKDTYEVSSEEQKIKVNILCTGTVESLITDDWIQLISTKSESAGDKTVFIGEYLIKKNKSENERNAIITFKSSFGISKQIKITQKGGSKDEDNEEKGTEGAGNINSMKEHNW